VSNSIFIRSIRQDDDVPIAKIIRDALTEHGLNKPGTVFTDPETDHLSSIYQKEKSGYFIAELDGKIVGGAGIGPVGDVSLQICELQKMYLIKDERGKGISGLLMQKCFETARQFGYTHCYLETATELAKAVQIYRHWGFEQIENAIGDTGHFSCDIKMLKALG
jgi:putative acetyltransferase